MFLYTYDWLIYDVLKFVLMKFVREFLPKPLFLSPLQTPAPPRECGLSKSFMESLPVIPYNNEVSSSFQGSL